MRASIPGREGCAFGTVAARLAGGLASCIADAWPRRARGTVDQHQACDSAEGWAEPTVSRFASAVTFCVFQNQHGHGRRSTCPGSDWFMFVLPAAGGAN